MTPENRNNNNKNCKTVQNHQQNRSKINGGMNRNNHENQNSIKQALWMTSTAAMMWHPNDVVTHGREVCSRPGQSNPGRHQHIHIL